MDFNVKIFLLAIAFAPAAALSAETYLEHLQEDAEYGNAQSQFTLARMHFVKDSKIPIDYNKGLYWAEKAAMQGHPDALNLLGNIYEHGLDLDPDIDKAVEYYKKAADKGSSMAKVNLALLDYAGVLQPGSSPYSSYLATHGVMGPDNTLIDQALVYFKGIGVEPDLEKAFKLFEQSHNEGNLLATRNLAIMYMEGIHAQKDMAKAFELFKKVAERGDSQSMNSFGLFYYRGMAVEQDYETAFRYFKRAAMLGNITAAMNLAMMYGNGNYVEKNTAKAIEYLHKAAEQGYPSVMHELGNVYMLGKYGIPIDYPLAMNYYMQAAKRGDCDAQNSIGYMYLNGLGVEKNLEEAYKWFILSMEGENSHAFNNIGWMHFKGMHVEKDIPKAVEYFEKAAEKHNSGAINRLIDIYYEGKDDYKADPEKAFRIAEFGAKIGMHSAQTRLGYMYYKSRNYEQAFNLFSQAAEHDDADALNNLGYMYLDGIFVEKDIIKGLELIGKAAEFGRLGSANTLVDIFFNGERGFEKNYEIAFKYAKISASKGDIRGIYALALMHHNAYHVDKDYMKAFELFSAAAEKGHLDSMDYVAFYYYEDKFGMKDWAKAVEWFERCAEKGSGYAAEMLGYMYMKGEHVEKDIFKAIGYFEKSAAKNRSYSLVMLGDIYYLERNGVEKDYKKAFEYYERAVKRNDSYAKFRYGYMVKEGEYGEKNRERGLEYINASASEGYGRAQEFLGRHYKANKDFPNSFRWSAKAADQGYFEALENVRKLLEDPQADKSALFKVYFDNIENDEKEILKAYAWHLFLAEKGFYSGEKGLILMRRIEKDFTLEQKAKADSDLKKLKEKYGD